MQGGGHEPKGGYFLTLDMMPRNQVGNQWVRYTYRDRGYYLPGTHWEKNENDTNTYFNRRKILNLLKNDPTIFRYSYMEPKYSNQLTKLNREYTCENYDQDLNLQDLNKEFMLMKSQNVYSKYSHSFTNKDVDEIEPLFPSQTRDVDYHITHLNKIIKIIQHRKNRNDNKIQELFNDYIKWLKGNQNITESTHVFNKLELYIGNVIVDYSQMEFYYKRIYGMTYSDTQYYTKLQDTMPKLMMELLLSELNNRNCSFKINSRADSGPNAIFEIPWGERVATAINIQDAKNTSVFQQFFVGFIIECVILAYPIFTIFDNINNLKHLYERDIVKLTIELISYSPYLILNILQMIIAWKVIGQIMNIELKPEFHITSIGMQYKTEMTPDNFKGLIADYVNHSSSMNHSSVESSFYEFWSMFYSGSYGGFLIYILILIAVSQELIYLWRVDYVGKYNKVFNRMIYGDAVNNYYEGQKELQQIRETENQIYYDSFKQKNPKIQILNALPNQRNEAEPAFEKIFRHLIYDAGMIRPKPYDIVFKIFTYGVPGLVLIICFKIIEHLLSYFIDTQKFEGIYGFYSNDNAFNEKLSNSLSKYQYFKPSVSEKYYLHQFYYKNIVNQPYSNIEVNNIYYHWMHEKYTEYRLLKHYGYMLIYVITLIFGFIGIYSWINLTDYNNNLADYYGYNFNDLYSYYKRLNEYFGNLRIEYQIDKRTEIKTEGNANEDVDQEIRKVSE